MTLILFAVAIVLAWLVSRIVHISDDKQLSDYRVAQLIHQCELEEQAEKRRKQRARDQPSKYPHDFADVSYRVRIMSNAEQMRIEQERKTLQFLRGDKG